MFHPFTFDHFKEGAEEDFDVKAEGLVKEVEFVEIDFYGDGEFVSAIDLGPAGKSWCELMDSFLGSE